jgi:hypothetical protein
MILLGWLRCYRHIGSTAQESIDEDAKAEQVIDRADEQRSLWRAGGSLEVCPVGGDPRFTAVRQNDHELQSVGHADLPQDLQRLSFEWVMRTRDGHAFGEVLMMGSVSWFPSITYSMICC